jgi:DNA transformation protein and related proteins
VTEVKSTAKPVNRARGPLRSMRVSASFRDFVLDQLAGLSALEPRAMFGGLGLYSDDVFFGILAADVLYFKVDETNRPEYEAAGSSPFQPYPDQAISMSYYNVPLVVLEDAVALRQWATRSVAIARAAKASKPGRTSHRAKASSPAKKRK